MKKLTSLPTRYLWLVAAVLTFSLFVSCKTDEPAEKIGLTELSFTPTSGTITYACDINHDNSTVENSNDSLPSNTPIDILKSVKITSTATIGATAYINGEPISETAIYDLSTPITIVVKKEKAQDKTYVLTALKSRNDESAKAGVKLTSDMTLGGLAAYHDLDVAFFKGKFYAMTSRYNGDFTSAYYEMFTSENGLNWTKTPAAPGSVGGPVGGQGARFAVFNDRLYALGGARFWGKDENGVEPEMSTGWSVAPTISNWRSWSTSDGLSWKVDTVGVQWETYINFSGAEARRLKKPAPVAYANFAVLNGKMYLKGGKTVIFGGGQAARLYYSTSDGTNWDLLTVTNPATDLITNRTDEAFFVFKNKLWIIGGFTNFLSAANVLGNIWSSSDGLTCAKEADEAPFGKIYGHKVVTDGNTLLLFGGETFNEDKTRTISNKVYRSVDGVNWTEVTMANGFEARRNPPVVANGSTAWIFGGWGVSTGSYAFTDKATDIQIRDTWTKGIQ